MKYAIGIIGIVLMASCAETKKAEEFARVHPDALKPVLVTDTVQFDTDDPAIWINPQDSSASLVIGTDKETGGGLYAFGLDGKLVRRITGLQRPNNVDIAYGFSIAGKQIDIAVFTEREAHKIRVVQLPSLEFIDNGGIPVFEGETGDGFQDGMGIALYKDASGSQYAIVGRKNGKSGEYLWQYQLSADSSGTVKAQLVRKFGSYSGKKEIEAIAVDTTLGYVYYCDEQVGVRKYFADPSKGNAELAVFGRTDFLEDNEGISIYQQTDSTGYILISNQQDNSFNVYRREGDSTGPHLHKLLAKIPLSTIESDGSEITSVPLPGFPKGIFVAMSNGKVFQYYRWEQLLERIDAAAK